MFLRSGPGVRRGATVLLSSAALCAAAVPAWAAPFNAPGTEPLTLTCPGDVPTMIVSPPGNGSYTPGFLVDTHQLLIPYSFSFTITSGDESESFAQAKKAPVPSDAFTCTINESGVEDGVPFSFTGSVVVTLRGKP